MSAHTPTPALPLQNATLAGGCFWCLEAVFLGLKGVRAVEPGYSNGQHPLPTYERVCGGDTGHAEVVRLSFDPSVICYTHLLAVFFKIHYPTTPKRQGHDVGTQYRSGIYTHSEEQAREARAVIESRARAIGCAIEGERAPQAGETLHFTTRPERLHAFDTHEQRMAQVFFQLGQEQTGQMADRLRLEEEELHEAFDRAFAGS